LYDYGNGKKANSLKLKGVAGCPSRIREKQLRNNVVVVSYNDIPTNRGPNGMIQVFYCAK
jgi:hypothetical protein